MSERTKITLTSPVKEAGEDIHEISLREPNGGDIADCGVLGGDNESNGRTLAAYIAKLANIPPSTVRQLSLRDFLAAARVVSSFFEAATAEN